MPCQSKRKLYLPRCCIGICARDSPLSTSGTPELRRRPRTPRVTRGAGDRPCHSHFAATRLRVYGYTKDGSRAHQKHFYKDGRSSHTCMSFYSHQQDPPPFPSPDLRTAFHPDEHPPYMPPARRSCPSLAYNTTHTRVWPAALVRWSRPTHASLFIGNLRVVVPSRLQKLRLLRGSYVAATIAHVPSAFAPVAYSRTDRTLGTPMRRHIIFMAARQAVPSLPLREGGRRAVTLLQPTSYRPAAVPRSRVRASASPVRVHETASSERSKTK